MGRDLNGRTAVVTGAASGIGAATVARLIADGAAVLAVDRTADGLGGTHTLLADVGQPAAILDIVARATAAFGGLDILINNAGVCPSGPFEAMTDADWDLALAINVTAAMKLSRAALPLLKQSRAGRIVNTGSIMSRYGDAGLVAYATSKHAILGLTRALAMECGPFGITVNCVQPGAIVTGMTKAAFADVPGFADHYTARSALGRLGEPEDIADVFAFLVSDDARFITGQGLMVDGGVMTHS